jgi:Ca2+/Na+ antiporter
MDDGATLAGQIKILLPLLGAAAGWYIAGRAAVASLGKNEVSPLKRAAAHCIAVGILSLIAVMRHESQIAIGVIFGASIASLSLVLGVITFTAPPDMITIDARRKWAFVLPAAILVFLAGYQSQFTWLHALIFAVQGTVMLILWSEQTTVSGPADSAATRLTSTDSVESPHRDDASVWIAPALILFSVALSIVSGWWGVSGARTLLSQSNLPSMSILAATMLGPGLVISMIGTGTELSHRHQFTAAASTQVAFVLLNLCVVLPITIVVWYVHKSIHPFVWRELLDRLRNVQADFPLHFPAIVWRVDVVMLMLLGLALLPMSLGRWLPGKTEGAVLIFLYAAYLLLWRWATMIG